MKCYACINDMHDKCHPIHFAGVLEPVHCRCEVCHPQVKQPEVVPFDPEARNDPPMGNETNPEADPEPEPAPKPARKRAKKQAPVDNT